MLLNYEFHQTHTDKNTIPVVFIHGLFGSLSNLGMLARALQAEYDVVQIDLRNHGHSAHSDDMNYMLMAADIVETLKHLDIDDFHVVGHSMGAKVAMQLTLIAPEQLQKLIILDMAPVAYQENHHDQVFKALFAVEQAAVQSRKAAMDVMRNFLTEEMVIQFLLKSFYQGRWLFNVHALFEHYQDILSWTNIPIWQKSTLFIRGGLSPYVAQKQYLHAIEQQFSHAQICTIEHAGHWLHAEKTDQVNGLIADFLVKSSS